MSAIFQRCLSIYVLATVGNALRADRSGEHADSRPDHSCKQWISVLVKGTNVEGQEIEERNQYEYDDYGAMGGLKLFSVYKSFEDTEKPQVYFIVCDWLRKIPVVAMEEEGPDGMKTHTASMRTGTERVRVGIRSPQVAEFSPYSLFFETLVKGSIEFSDSTGVFYRQHYDESAQAPPVQAGEELHPDRSFITRFVDKFNSVFTITEEEPVQLPPGRAGQLLATTTTTTGRLSREEELELARASGKKLCTHTVQVKVTGTLHVTKKQTEQLQDHLLLVTPDEYVRLGGYKVMWKFLPKKYELDDFTDVELYKKAQMKPKEDDVEDEKRYFIRCDYDRGMPFLLMHHQKTGQWEIREFSLVFDLIQIDRKVTIDPGWFLKFYTNFKIPRDSDVSDGLVTFTLTNSTA